MSQPPPIDVAARCTVVPDGIDPASGRAQLSIVIQPNVSTRTDEAVIDLRQWPTQIAAIDTNTSPNKLFIFLHDRTGALSAAIGDGQILRAQGSPTTVSQWNDRDLRSLVGEAQALWKRIFEPKGVNGYSTLIRRVKALSVPRDYAGAEELNHAAAASAIERVHSRTIERSLRMANALALRKRLSGTPSLSNANADRAQIAADAPFEPKDLWRDWRTQHQAFIGPDGAIGAFANLELVAGKALTTPQLQATAETFLNDDAKDVIAQYFRTWGTASQSVVRLAADDLAGRSPGKYGAIRSHPAIMKYLKLIIDVELESALLEDGVGLIAAAVVPGMPDFAAARALAASLPKTAYQCRRSAGQASF